MAALVTVIFDGIAYVMLLYLLCVGLSVTLGLMNFVNLAHGVFAMLGGYTALWVVNALGGSFFVAMGAAFMVASLAGGVLEAVLFRRLYNGSPLDQVLLFIGVVFVVVAVSTLLFRPEVVMFHFPVSLQGQLLLGGIV